MLLNLHTILLRIEDFATGLKRCKFYGIFSCWIYAMFFSVWNEITRSLLHCGVTHIAPNSLHGLKRRSFGGVSKTRTWHSDRRIVTLPMLRLLSFPFQKVSSCRKGIYLIRFYQEMDMLKVKEVILAPVSTGHMGPMNMKVFLASVNIAT